MVEITRTICYNSMSVKFWNKILFQLVPGGSIIIQIGKNNWDLATYRT
jgi:hypothetical protein